MLKDRALELEWSIDKNSRRSAEGRLTNSICFKCNKEGHYFRNCPELESEEKKKREWEEYEREKERMDLKDREGKQLRGYICFKCGKEGHVAQDCKSDDNGPGFKGVICFKCGIGGHLANKCDKRVRGCFLCRKDGHIASECTEKDIHPLMQGRLDEKDDRYASTPDDQQWESTQKYRRVMSPENKDYLRAPSKDSQYNSNWEDREKARDKKLSGWDERGYKAKEPYYDSYGNEKSVSSHDIQYDRDPRLSNGNRDPRYSASSPNSLPPSATDSYSGFSNKPYSEDAYRNQYSRFVLC
jgi:hypothetical protein